MDDNLKCLRHTIMAVNGNDNRRYELRSAISANWNSGSSSFPFAVLINLPGRCQSLCHHQWLVWLWPSSHPIMESVQYNYWHKCCSSSVAV